jgi:hypothetical protein
VSFVLGLERMTIEVEMDPSLAALLVWCLLFVLKKKGVGIYGFHARGGQCDREPKMARL